MVHEEQVNSVQEGLTWTRVSKTRICTQTSCLPRGSWALGSPHHRQPAPVQPITIQLMF